jgi:hypothetical protein
VGILHLLLCPSSNWSVWLEGRETDRQTHPQIWIQTLMRISSFQWEQKCF